MRLSSELQVQLIRTMSYETLECRLAMTIDSIGDDLPIDQHSSPTLELHGSLESVVEAPSLVLHGIGQVVESVPAMVTHSIHQVVEEVSMNWEAPTLVAHGELSSIVEVPPLMAHYELSPELMMHGELDVPGLIQPGQFQPGGNLQSIGSQGETVQPVGDFQLEDLFEIDSDSDLSTSLSDAHETTGVNFVHDNYGLDGTGQTVAIIDSGIAWDHANLGGGFGENYRVVGGYDFTENDIDPYDDGPSGFHGTHVAGIVASDHETHRGVSPGVDLVGLRVFGDNGGGSFAHVEQALQWVHDHRNDFEHEITTVNLSLGTTWNSDSIPSWAMLEDEFAQLEQDGIFIAVAAGNSFANYNAPGLSYPAASSYVVPIGSVTNSGVFSGFSQRNDRILAAPGSSITSTVPDHVYGTPNSFGNASGTSMASPYAAGASVLVRQALEIVGQTDIDQDMIYDHLRDTADVFYDSATNANYHRINLQSAIDSLLGEDDHGSTVSTATDLGTLTDTISVSGIVSNLNDSDYFRFTSATGGMIELTGVGMDMVDLQLDVVGASATANGDTVTLSVAAGQEVTVSASSTAGIGRFSLNIESTLPPNTVHLGAITQDYEVAALNSEMTYLVTASRTGTLTAEVYTHSDATVEILNQADEVIATAVKTAGQYRVDGEVQAGETYILRLAGNGSSADIRLTNLFQQVGDDLFELHGTAGNDNISIDTNTQMVVLNGVEYQAGNADSWELSLDTGGGYDTVLLNGTAADESITMRAGAVTLRSGDVVVEVNGAERVEFDGNGGTDIAHIYDTSSNDVFNGTTSEAQLSGGGYVHLVRGMSSVTAHSVNGGADTAKLYDSFGADEFIGRAHASKLSGAGFSNAVEGFADVKAYANNGGDDEAYMFDSAGDDNFQGYENYSFLTGDGFYTFASGFDSVNVVSENGGYDTAKLYDSSGADEFYGRADYSAMIGAGFYNHVRGFDKVSAYAENGGNDKAILHDSSGDDTYHGSEDFSYLKGDDFYNYVAGFDKVYAYSKYGGNDIATVYDSVNDDKLKGRHDYVLIRSSSYYNYVHSFDSVVVKAINGGVDVADLHDSSANDTFESDSTYSAIYSDTFHNRVEGFDRVYAHAIHGGYDTAVLNDSAGNDEFQGRDDYSVMSGSGFFNYARGFEHVSAYAHNGGQDKAILHDSDGDDRYYGRADHSLMEGDGFYNYAEGFDRVYAYAKNGGNDVADIQDSAGDDKLKSRYNYSQISGDNYFNYAYGFDRVSVYSINGGTDSASFNDSKGDDTFHAHSSYALMTGDGFYNYASGFDKVFTLAINGGEDTAVFHESELGEYQSYSNYSVLSGDGFYTYAASFETEQVTLEANSVGELEQASFGRMELVIPGATFVDVSRGESTGNQALGSSYLLTSSSSFERGPQAEAKAFGEMAHLSHQADAVVPLLYERLWNDVAALDSSVEDFETLDSVGVNISSETVAEDIDSLDRLYEQLGA